MISSAGRWGLDMAIARDIKYVFRRPSTATLASAVRWREDTADSWCVKILHGDVDVSATAVRWRERHETLSTNTGVCSLDSMFFCFIS